MSKSLNSSIVQSVASELGLKISAISSFLPSARNIESLANWQKNSYFGEMQFMNREVLRTPENLWPQFKSIITFSVYYSRKKRLPLPKGFGKVARYAWGRDYHKVLRKKLEKFTERLVLQSGINFNYRIFTDSVPLLERAVANQAGNGFIGKNTMLIRPKAGSFNFIAEILTDVEIGENKINVISTSCGECRRCQDLCPTSAFVSEYVLDARKCISYLTIEKRGVLSASESDSISDWLFGCDVCQDVCPFNHKSLKSEEEADLNEFDESLGAGQMLNLSEVLEIDTDVGFLDRFAGTPIMRTKRQGLIRNALIVAANTDCLELIPLIEEVGQKNKGHDEVLFHHAQQALKSLGVKGD